MSSKKEKWRKASDKRKRDQDDIEGYLIVFQCLLKISIIANLPNSICVNITELKKRKTLQIDIAFSSSYEALVMLKSSIFYKTGCKAKVLYLFHTRTNYELWAGGGDEMRDSEKVVTPLNKQGIKSFKMRLKGEVKRGVSPFLVKIMLQLYPYLFTTGIILKHRENEVNQFLRNKSWSVLAHFSIQSIFEGRHSSKLFTPLNHYFSVFCYFYFYYFSVFLVL